MDAWLGIGVIAAASTFFVVALLVAASRRASRSTDTMAAMGAMLGMEHKPVDRAIPWMTFRSLQRYGAFANVLDGDTEGLRVATAQAMPMGGGDASGPGVSVSFGSFGVGGNVMVQHEAAEPVAQRSIALAFTRPLPQLVIVRRGAMNALADRLFATSVDLELDSFNRAFVVRADDPKDAYTVLEQRMMEWLLMTDDRLAFETGATGVLVFGPLLPPDQMPMLVATAVGFARHLPRTAALG